MKRQMTIVIDWPDDASYATRLMAHNDFVSAIDKAADRWRVSVSWHSPETMKEIHPVVKHHLLAPHDLWWHIEEEHATVVDEISIAEHDVESWMQEHGVESAGDLDTDRLVMWHNTAHEGENDPYDDETNEPDRTCGVSFITGPREDPYGTNCDRPAGHYPTTKHEGDDPFGGAGRVRWTGGGSAGGDPLPYSNVEHVDPPSRDATYNGLPTGT
jgi:hypothetical protein